MGNDDGAPTGLDQGAGDIDRAALHPAGGKCWQDLQHAGRAQGIAGAIDRQGWLC